MSVLDHRDVLWERLTPTGENAEPSPSRPGERKFDQIVRNTTAPERHRLTGLVQYGGRGQPMTITAAGTRRLAAARASGGWTGFEIAAPAGSDAGEGANAEGSAGASSTEPRELRRSRGRTEATGFGAPYRPVDATVPATPRVPFTVDPDVIDRGTTEHKRAQTAVSEALRALGVVPLRNAVRLASSGRFGQPLRPRTGRRARRARRVAVRDRVRPPPLRHQPAGTATS